MKPRNHSKASLSQRFLRELKDLALLTAYFYVVFVTVILFKATVLHAYGIRYVVWGAAIAKAVLVAKFLLIGKAMKIGDGYAGAPLIKPILHKTVGFLVLLLAMTGVQEVVTGLIHGRSFSVVFHQFAGRRLGETVTEVLILLLVLIPFVAFSVFAEALGEGSLRRMLFEGRIPRTAVLGKGNPT